jgi:putative addiction module antidote
VRWHHLQTRQFENGLVQSKYEVIKVGNSIGTSFLKEVLDRLGLVEGDTMNLVVTDDGIKLVIHDPNFDKVLLATS